MIEQFLIRQSVLGSVTNMLLSAGTLSSNRSDVTFADSNGVSFGLNTNGVITATVQTNYLTTAMASNRGSDFVQATAAFFGTNASGTIASNAISVSVAAGGGGAGSVNISAGTTSIVSTAFTFSNSNGVSFGINTNAVITATVFTNYAGTGFTTATTAGTAVVGTLSTNGLSMGVPAYLTTAALSQDSSKYAGTGFTTATTAGTNVVGTLSTNGISMGIPAYLTTAMQSNAATISNINISAGTTSTNASAFTFSNSNNVSFGINGQTVTGSIATTYAGTGFTTATTAGTAIVGTLNTSGLSMGVPAYLTTAALSGDTSKYAGTGFTTTSTAGSNIVGTLATNGLSMGVPNYLTTALSNINISAGTTSTNASNFTFAAANGVSFGLGSGASTGSITASIATTYAGTGFTTATTSGTNIVGTLNTSGLSMGVPAYLTTAEQSRQFLSYFANFSEVPTGIPDLLVQSNTFYVLPITIPEKISISYLRLLAACALVSTTIATSAVNNATGASTAFSVTVANNAVLYTVGTGASSRSLQYVTSGNAGFTWAVSVSQASTSNASQQSITQKITYPAEGFNTASTTNQYSVSATNGPISTTQFGAIGANNVFLDVPLACSLSAGNYWLALNKVSGTVGGKNIDINNSSYGSTGSNIQFIVMNAASNSSNVYPGYGLGSWTTNVASTTSSIGFGSLSFSSSYFFPFVQFINQA